MLATNVAAVKFDFTSPPSENGYCGYGAITIFGTPSIAPAVPTGLNGTFQPPDNFIMSIGKLVDGRNYSVQSTTNLASSDWSTETNFVAAASVVAITNYTTNVQKFFRVVGF
jgi:hypothetical protein